MNHHTHPSETCLACQDKLHSADYRLVDWFTDIISRSFPDVHIAWSFRDKASQDGACAYGGSQLSWPKSKHNHTEDGVGSALALDLFQLLNEQAHFPLDIYSKIAKEYMLPIMQWGGNWKTLKDYDHFELI